MKKRKLQKIQDQASEALTKTNKKIEELGTYSKAICIELNKLQTFFDEIRNVPNSKKIEVENLKKRRLNWKQQVEKIEKEYSRIFVKNAKELSVGIGVGASVVSLGPTAAMGVATTFGVASTGTAISTLSGAAATNAALAWLGGGTLAAGGGGMAAGSAFLSLAGPVGWGIAGASILISGLKFWKGQRNKNKVEDIFVLIYKRDIKTYQLTTIELNKRIVKIENETKLLKEAIESLKEFGTDYSAMTEEQQYKLGAYVNLMNSSTQLLVNPIINLTPKFDEEEWQKYLDCKNRKTKISICKMNKKLIIALSNMLYEIKLDKHEKKLLYKTLRKDKNMLHNLNISKKEFNKDIIDIVEEALSCIY